MHLTFETHSWSEDNDRGVATGWLPGRLSARGRDLAGELGERRRDAAVVYVSDLGRAMETATIAFGEMGKPILADWRLRECDYGRLNGMPAIQLHPGRRAHLDEPYPEGESWRAAIGRVDEFLNDLQGRLGARWSHGRVLIIGHVATRWALDCRLAGRTLEDLVDADFAWREGWDYELDPS
ncbi:MAG TPA: histidine phosphatase family protein [Caulobacteraceae bacterium]|nr:histidine phosphatase family protein [Caulobacteraceae bacterium]